MAALNRRITLAARPVGFPRVADFHLAYSPLPSPGPDQVLVRPQYLSLDPHLRPRMDATSTGVRPLAIGEVIAGPGVGVVARSGDSRLRAGDAVEGILGWQEYVLAAGEELRKVDPDPPLSTALGILGLPGLTAYFGLLDVGQPKRGETVVVSGATGAIGMIAGQIAKLGHCRVVGLAEGDGDVSWLRDELGFDAAVGYERDADLRGRLAEVCPDGIDVYFDTVGGSTTDAVVTRINPRARICVSGQSSLDNLEAPELGPRWLGQLMARQAKVQGFMVSGCGDRFPAGRAQLGTWLAHGKLRYRESVAQGIESAPQAFIAMLQGKSQGSQLVQLWDEQAPVGGGTGHTGR